MGLVFKRTVFEDLNISMVESLIFEGFLFEGLQFWRLQFLKVLILGTSIFKDFSFANKSTHYLAQTCTWGKNKSWWFHSAEKLRSIPTSSSSYVLTLPPSFRSKFIKSVYLPYKCLLEAGDTGQLQRAHALGPHIIEGPTSRKFSLYFPNNHCILPQIYQFLLSFTWYLWLPTI